MKSKLILVIILWINLFYGQNIYELEANFYEISAEYEAIGAALTLVNGNEVHSFSYGYKDYDRQLRLNSETKFRIASVSKIITAMAAIKLVEDGLIDLDSDVSNYLGFTLRNPFFPNSPISLRHLLTHTAGLRDSDAYSNFLSQSYSSNPPSISELVQTSGDFYNSSLWSNYYMPGDYLGWDYSNLSAGLVATLVEVVSQEHFSGFCRDNFFLPLGIEACWNNYSALSDINDLAVLYRYNGDIPQAQADNFVGIYPDEINLEEIPYGWNGLIHSPQGGLRISSGDLAKIFLMLKNRGTYNSVEILQENSVLEMEEINWTGWGLGGFFTEMGLQLQRSYSVFSDELFIGHAGEAYGLISDAYYNLERDIVIIFVTNGANFSYGNLFYDYEEAIFSACQEWLDAVPNASEDLINKLSIDVYPNIISSLASDIKIKTSQRISKISLYNLKGQLIKEDRSGRKSFSCNGLNLVSGLYFLKIDSETNSILKKILLRK